MTPAPVLHAIETACATSQSWTRKDIRHAEHLRDKLNIAALNALSSLHITGVPPLPLGHRDCSKAMQDAAEAVRSLTEGAPYFAPALRPLNATGAGQSPEPLRKAGLCLLGLAMLTEALENHGMRN